MKRVLLYVILLLLTACSQMPSKRTQGTIIGGVAGGAVGTQFGNGDGNKVAIIAFTLLGAAAGHEAGGMMEELDHYRSQQNQPQANGSSWQEPKMSSSQGRIDWPMEPSDILKTQRALELTRDGDLTSWWNYRSGNLYSITPTRTFYTDTGPCRDYEMTGRIQGNRELESGTVCRNHEGRWLAAR